MKVKYPIFWGVLGLALLVFVALVLTGKKMWFSEQPPIVVIADMDDQFKVKPQRGSTFFADRKSNREPVANTLPRDGHSYPFGMGDVDKAEAMFASGNPLPKSEFIMARGQNRFYTFCSPCHNFGGTGDGLVQQKGMGSSATMNLMRPEARAYSDAKIFHIISVGQNIMPSYADRLSEVDRWAVIHYVRELQSAAAAKDGGTAPAVPTTPTDTSAHAANASGAHANITQAKEGGR